MFKWEKMGLVFSPQKISDIPWMKEFAQGPSVLVFDDFIRVYFSCRPHPDENHQYVSYTGYVDLNRSNLSEIISVSQTPILELGASGTFDEFGVYPTSVIRRDGEVLAYYGGWTRCESVPFNVAIGRAVSTDGGKTFRKSGPGPVLSYSPEEPFVLSGPKIREFDGRLYLYYIAGNKWLPNDGKAEPVYKIRMATSMDGLHWEKLNRNLIPDRLEADECQASPDVLFFNNKYHMFFCYRYSLNYRCKQGGYRIGYASSEDAITWVRDDARVGIDISNDGWDSEMISYPHVFALDNQVYMFYLGNQVGRFGFGLARLQDHSY